MFRSRTGKTQYRFACHTRTVYAQNDCVAVSINEYALKETLAGMRAGENIVANAVYGYRKNESGKWEPDPEPAAIVRDIFAMALAGLPTALIRDRLSNGLIPTPKEYLELKRGKDIFPECMWESKAIGSHSHSYNDKSDWIMIPDRHPPLVSKEDFAAVHEIMERFRNATTVKPVENPFQGEISPRRSRMMSGEWTAATPIYGYLKGDGGKWEIDGEAAPVIREIYNLARQGAIFAEISGKLTEAGYPTPSERIKQTKGCDVLPLCQWTAKSVRLILKNVQYTGAFVSGKILRDSDTGKSYHTAENDWIVIPGRHPAIVGSNLFDEVQSVIAAGRVRRKNMRPQDYLLRGGILKCGCCGYALSFDPSSQGGVYRCNHTLSAPAAECHRMKVNAGELDEAVLSIIKKQVEVVIGTEDLSKFRKTSADEKQAAEYKKQIRECEEQRQQCYEQFVLHEINHDVFMERKKECAAQIDRLNQRLDLIRQAGRDGQAKQKAVELAKTVVNESLSQREVINTLIDKILVFPGNRLEIQWKVSDFTAEL
jgi:hypothetical protein